MIKEAGRIVCVVGFVGSIGCGEPAAEMEGGEEASPRASSASVWSTCDFEAGAGADYVEPRVAPAGSELRVIAIHEAVSGLGDGRRVAGEAHVTVDRRAPTVLVLSAAERTHWVLTVEPGSRLEKVIVDGRASHTIRAPAGVPVENRSGSTAALAACGYADEGECRREALIGGAERATGLALAGFVGCRYGNEFGIYEGE